VDERTAFTVQRCGRFPGDAVLLEVRVTNRLEVLHRIVDGLVVAELG
jgi:hypothetical protein